MIIIEKQATTIYDVANLAGVSIATVSRTLARPYKVRQATQERVINAMIRLNWTPNKVAQDLALILAEYRRK